MKTQYENLVVEIQKASEEGITLLHAERVAGQALLVLNELSLSLTVQDKDRRMRKRGLKIIKSSVRLDEVKKYDKKPTEGALDDAVNLNELVQVEEDAFDDAEILKEETERQYEIAKESHLYFRGISKGAFNG